MKPMIFILLVTSVCHVALVWLFTYPLGMGFLGAPTATATAQCLMLAIGIAVVYFRGYYKETWPALSMDIFHGWFAILRFGLPGMLMLCLEWWSFELCALAAGWLGAIQLDSFVVVLQVQSFIFMIPLGLSIAISTVTGNRLGAGQPQAAKQGAAVAIFIGLVTQTVVAVICLAARSQLGSLFSSDEAVVELVGGRAAYHGSDAAVRCHAGGVRRRAARYRLPEHWRCNQLDGILRICQQSTPLRRTIARSCARSRLAAL